MRFPMFEDVSFWEWEPLIFQGQNLGDGKNKFLKWIPKTDR